MRKEIPELNALLSEVERKYGRRIATSTDFEALSVVIEHEINEMISASTLKRLWGYVSSNPSPRVSTLDILSRYVGKRDYKGFCTSLILTAKKESGSFSGKYISASELEPGQDLVIGWNPNRLVTLKYMGAFRFKTISSANAQLQVGDEFETTNFSLGYPLYIPLIYRGAETLPSYIAGSVNGLTVLELK